MEQEEELLEIGGVAGNRKVSSGHDVSSSRDYSHISA